MPIISKMINKRKGISSATTKKPTGLLNAHLPNIKERNTIVSYSNLGLDF